ncbi:MAG: TerB family tellurite resistance protein [Alphaproteobacteria bacterium]|nr:TerB family tellurite resistance protein [Alphaproteobacteria bacterium]
MLRKLMNFFKPDESGTAVNSAKPLHLAAAGLLVEAATADADYGASQRDVIVSLCRDRFGLTQTDAEELVAEAEEEAKDTSELYGFTRTVREQMPPEDRVQIIEMLWEVVYADGVLHDYEAGLLRRISGLIYVEDQESGAARKRVMAKLGLTGR